MGESKHAFIVSGYTDHSTNKGIYLLELDNKGKGRAVKGWEHGGNPSFLENSKEGNKIFVANEREDVCRIDLYIQKHQDLIYRKSIELEGSGVCHLLYSPLMNRLYASCYGSGHIYCLDGNLENVCGKVVPEIVIGTSHAHGGVMSSDERWLITVDLGLNYLGVYDLKINQPLQNQLKQRFDLGCGIGPREVKLNEKANKLYVVNELENTLGIYEFNTKKGLIIKEIVRIKTSLLTSDIRNYPSSCIMTSNGQWLLLANRGYNTISILKIDSSGMPVLYKEHSCGGDWPRYITLTRDERFLLVANQNSHEVSVLEYNQQDGDLKWIDAISVKNASCIVEQDI